MNHYRKEEENGTAHDQVLVVPLMIKRGWRITTSVHGWTRSSDGERNNELPTLSSSEQTMHAMYTVAPAQRMEEPKKSFPLESEEMV